MMNACSRCGFQPLVGYGCTFISLVIRLALATVSAHRRGELRSATKNRWASTGDWRPLMPASKRGTERVLVHRGERRSVAPLALEAICRGTIRLVPAGGVLLPLRRQC